MKKVLLLLFILCSLTINAQPPSVAGVQFGSTYNQAKAILDKRFNGGDESYQRYKNKLSYYDINFGGEYFYHAQFSFEKDINRSYLSSVMFSNSFELSESAKAKAMRDRLFETYKAKYAFRWEFINDDGFKGYVLGNNYFNEDDGFIIIETFKGKTNSGETKLWTSVSYYCEGFVNVEDEI